MSLADDWDGLLKHPGWLRFYGYVKTQWGPEGYARRLKQAIGQAREQQQDIGTAVSVVDFASDEINAMMDYPKQQLRHAQHADQPVDESMSRRGPL